MTIDITPVVQAFIALLCAVITGYVIPLIKEKTSAETQRKINNWVDIAVYAAEKLYGSGNGTNKYYYVKNFLLSRGFTIDHDALEVMINSAIKSMEIDEGFEREYEEEEEETDEMEVD